MKTKIILSVSFLLINFLSWGQGKTVSLKDGLKKFVFETDTTFENKLVTNRAFNLFLQKKSSYYLTGASEISLSKAYATYSSDNDKFNFGVNFKVENDDKQLKWLFTPLFESNIKKSFTTLYKKGEWQSDIRLGGKASIFFKGKIKYKGMNIGSNEKTKLIIVRNLELSKILKKIDADEKARLEKVESSNILVKLSLDSLKQKTLAKAKSEKEQIQFDRTKMYLDSIMENNNKIISELIRKESDNVTTEEEYKTQIANAEVDELYKNNSYTYFQNFWFSVWGFVPLTERKTFIATDNTQNFKEQKLNLWEVNAQLNYLREYNNKFSIFVTAGWKVFQNNSAIADLMTTVDYYQYSQFPQTNTTISNLALIENNKAYVGTFKEFTTTSFNSQIVLSLSNTNKDGMERFCTPGISIYFEKNLGEYSATNLRFGFPLRFRGKATPINIEPQIRLNNIDNYSNKTDYKVMPTIGINVGLPFSSLFK